MRKTIGICVWAALLCAGPGAVAQEASGAKAQEAEKAPGRRLRVQFQETRQQGEATPASRPWSLLLHADAGRARLFIGTMAAITWSEKDGPTTIFKNVGVTAEVTVTTLPDGRYAVDGWFEASQRRRMPTGPGEAPVTAGNPILQAVQAQARLTLREGEKVLDLLARHPKTAYHISLKLARRFVSDTPPPALVDRMAQTYLKTDGDIRAVLRTMLDSPEFWSAEAYRAKIKTPFELVVSAARAVATQPGVPAMLVQWTGRIGQPLYQYEAPTGYPDTAESWVNTGALLNRMNFSLALTGNRLPGVRTDVAALLGDPARPGDSAASLDKAIDVLLGGQVSPETRRTLEARLNDPQILQASLDDPVREINYGVVAGLVLGAPEFQRR